jgi:hypothetical protein
LLRKPTLPKPPDFDLKSRFRKAGWKRPAFFILFAVSVRYHNRMNGRQEHAMSDMPERSAKAGTASAEPTLLSGGNPQIPKGYGDAPVQAYIAAMPGWKREVGQRIDALVARAVPNAAKAVKWNSPFYGIEGQGWFLSFHCFAKYVKLTFFRGTSLDPVPPESSKAAETRYFHIRENEAFDAAQLEDWIRQASLLPGEKL